MDGFNAGSVFIEYEIRTEKLSAGFRKIERLSARSAKVSSATFEKEFKARQTGEKIGSDLGRGFQSATKKLGVAGKAVGAGFGIAEQIYTVTKSALEAATEIDRLSTEVGVGVEQFQELRIAAQQFGVEGNDIVEVLETMNRGVGKLINNTGGDASIALGKLKLSDDIKSEKLAGTVEIFDAIVDRLGNVTNAQQRATLSAQIFGRANGSKLNTMLNQGSAGIAKAKEEARKLGQVLSGETVASAVEANDNIDKLGRTLKTQLTSAILQAAPHIEDITEQLVILIPKLLEWTAAIGGFFVGVAEGFEEVSKRIAILQAAIKTGKFSLLSNNAFKTDQQLLDKDIKLRKKLTKVMAEQYKIRSRKPPKQAGRLGFDYNEIREKSLRAKLDKLYDELDAVEAEQARRAKLGNSKENVSTETGTPKPSSPKFPSKEIDRSVVSRDPVRPAEDNSLEKLLDEWQAYVDGIKLANEELREQGRLLKEQTATPIEQFTAKMEALAAAQSNIFIAEGAGGDETFNRARVQALEEYASATGKYEDALDRLVQLHADGKISADSFGQGFQNLTDKMGGAAHSPQMTARN